MTRPLSAAAGLLAALLLLAAPGAADEHLPGLKENPPGPSWRSRPHPYPVTPAPVSIPVSAPRPAAWELTDEERSAARGVAERHGPVREAVAGRAHQLAVVPWHTGEEKIGAGVHFRFDRPETIETDWPGGWPFGGRYRMRHVSEFIAMVDLRRG